MWLAGAHPRVSGENLAPAANVQTVIGSSPRERGKRLNGLSHVIQAGLIPA